MHARFIAAARLEFLAEIVYYSETQPGLGERLDKDVAVVGRLPLRGSQKQIKSSHECRIPQS